MADLNHLATLLSGRVKWKQFRDAFDTVKPDLSETDFAMADFRGCDLSDCNLRNTRFNGALLSGVDFSDCILGQTDFAEADLTGADFFGATLDKSVLRETRALQANFAGCKVSGANFSKAALARASFERADLEDACFDAADIRGASFEYAHGVRINFQKANAKGANFFRADLRESKFIGTFAQRASFIHATLSNADFTGANLTGSRFGESILADCNFSKIIGLESCGHEGPSFVDFRTLRKFTSIPTEFLVGCGLAEWQIKTAELLEPDLDIGRITDIGYDIVNARTGKPIQIGSLFISYSSKDSRFVDELGRLFAEDGIRYWRDAQHATAGRLEAQIDRAIRLNSTMIIVLSKNSVVSDWVEWEASRARLLEKDLGKDVLCPVSLDLAWKTCNWSGPLRRQIEKYHILDFRKWKDSMSMDAQYRKLVSGLRVFYVKEEKASQ